MREMRPAISNMWVNVQGISRRTCQAILGSFDGSAAACLRQQGVIGPQLEAAMASSKLGTRKALPTYVDLAFADDCLRMIVHPIAVYAANDGDWNSLNLSSLMPMLKPVAQCYAVAFPIYRPFESLTKGNLLEFIDTYLCNDTGFFSHDFEETVHLSIKLCRTASFLIHDGGLVDDYLDGVLTPLFNKSVQLTGTKHDIMKASASYRTYFDSMRYFPGSASPQRSEIAPSPPRADAQPIVQDKKADQGLASVGTLDRPHPALGEALAELDGLIGIPRVKEEVRKLAAFLSVRKEREKHGLPTRSRTLHFVFTGNPGTGKTTVARIVAKILHGFELLKTPKVVETDRAGLVAGYLGQTAIKTDEVIASALDGVLFIDEAYALSDLHDQDAFGKEAIGTLLKRMEDNRDRLSVIVAGYPKLMEAFLKSNPGLSSRFTRTIQFDDYSVSELGRIFLEYCKQAKYELDSNCFAVLSVGLATAYAQRDEHFGNARFVRNLFEEVQMRSSQRLYANARGSIERTDLVRLDPSDFMVGPLNGIPLTAIRVDAIKWHSTCTTCEVDPKNWTVE